MGSSLVFLGDFYLLARAGQTSMSTNTMTVNHDGTGAPPNNSPSSEGELAPLMWISRSENLPNL